MMCEALLYICVLKDAPHLKKSQSTGSQKLNAVSGSAASINLPITCTSVIHQSSLIELELNHCLNSAFLPFGI